VTTPSKEYKPKHDRFVLGCIHIAAQYIGRSPDLLFKAYSRSITAVCYSHSIILLFINTISTSASKPYVMLRVVAASIRHLALPYGFCDGTSRRAE
jgi:hypothetical protein